MQISWNINCHFCGYLLEIGIVIYNRIKSSKMNQISSFHENELDRLLALSNLGIDYYEPKQGLNYLTELAAKICGTEISLVNLIDSFTQWSVSSYGMDISQMPREESVCQYTIHTSSNEGLEVKDLRDDERFKNMFYVKGSPNLITWGFR